MLYSYCCPDCSSTGHWDLWQWALMSLWYTLINVDFLFCFAFLFFSTYWLSEKVLWDAPGLFYIFPIPVLELITSSKMWTFTLVLIFSVSCTQKLLLLTSLCVSAERQVLKESFQVLLPNKKLRNRFAFSLLRLLYYWCQML